MAVSHRNAIALSGITAINGVAKAGLTAINGESLSGGGGGSYALRDQFNGASKDTGLWDATTRTAGWNSGATIGGSDSEGSGIVTITPTTNAAERVQGRSSVATNLVLTSKELWIWVTSAPSAANQTSDIFFGYCHTANRGAQNYRWGVVNNFGSLGIETNFNNFGGGTQYSAAYDATNHAWLGLVDTGSNVEFYTATNNAGAPGTRTLRHSVSAGGGSYFAPGAGDIGAWVSATNLTACPWAFGEIYLTA